MKKNNLKFNPENWFFWGRWMGPLLGNEPWTLFSQSSTAEKLGLRKILNGDVINADGYFYSSKNDFELIKKIVSNAWSGHNDYFEKLFEACENEVKELEKVAEKNDLVTLQKRIAEACACSMFIHFTDRASEDYLRDACRRNNVSYEDMILMIRPKRETLSMKYQKALLELDKKDMKEFLKKYSWMGTQLYSGTPLTEERILVEKKGSKAAKEKQVAKHDFPEEIEKIINTGSELAYYRTNLYETMTMAANRHWPELESLARLKNTTFEKITGLTHQELIKAYKESVLPKDFSERDEKTAIGFIDKKVIVFSQSQSRELVSAIEKELSAEVKKEDVSIKGTVAFRGVAIGRVKIVQSVKDVGKVNHGDIIVAPETTPDYIVAMRKAAAFVTNQGGITSHAAIISREMQKPCIVGTKIATNVLNDGDLVEVDAIDGVVKIVKSDVKTKNADKKTVKKQKTAKEEKKPAAQKKIKNASEPNIAWFKEIGIKDIPSVGGKGASLGEMFSRFPIPNGFCITVNAYSSFLEENKLDEKIYSLLRGLDTDDTKKLDSASKKIEKIIMNAKISDSLRAEIISNYNKLENKFVAVRSSATAEDLPTASFAGQQATFLNIKGENEVINAVKSCWASLFTSRAIYYRVMNKFEHENVFISVVVQEMVDSAKAGVMFSVNPVNKDRNQIIIEGSFGLGESVVSGSVNPDSYLVSKRGFTIIEKRVNEKRTGIFRLESGNTKTVELDSRRANEQCLSDKEVIELAKIGVKIEEHYKKPEDIEWAVDGKGRIFILQSRPITTL